MSPLDGDCLAALRDHRRAQLKRRLKPGPAWRDYDLVLNAVETAQFAVVRETAVKSDD